MRITASLRGTWWRDTSPSSSRRRRRSIPSRWPWRGGPTSTGPPTVEGAGRGEDLAHTTLQNWTSLNLKASSCTVTTVRAHRGSIANNKSSFNKVSVVVPPAAVGGMQLQPGRHVYPFTCQLPHGCVWALSIWALFVIFYYFCYRVSCLFR